MDLTGYKLDKLRDDGEFALYRARLPGNPIPVLALVAERPMPASLKRLQHEYAFAAELHPSWAARPLAFDFQMGPRRSCSKTMAASPWIGASAGRWS